MGFRVALVSGPRCSGKTTVICTIIEGLGSERPHYVRLAAADGSKKAPQPDRPRPGMPGGDCGVASASWLTYQPDRVFEILPEALARIHKRDRRGLVILEADADPNLRHAYPYDCDIFVMPAPVALEEVFRSSEQARKALRLVLNDTGVFAEEIYGLGDGDDSAGIGSREDRTDMSDSQIGTLLRTPLGRELGTRIQLQPTYQGLMASDVVVVNTQVGGSTEVVDQAVASLEALMSRPRPGRTTKTTIFCCDPKNPHDPRCQKMCKHVRKLCARVS